MQPLLIASNNPWKVKVFAPVLQPYGFEVVSLRDISSHLPPPVENGSSVIENALIKARHYHSPETPWVFGDDTGLEIDALNGEPGVQLRRWNGKFSDQVDDQTWLNYLLARLDSVPPERRTARFIDGWAFIDPQGRAHTYQTSTSFQIACQPIRPIQPGSPVMSVAVGLPDDPRQIAAEIQARWKAWGILDQLLGSAEHTTL